MRYDVDDDIYGLNDKTVREKQENTLLSTFTHMSKFLGKNIE